MGLVHDFSVDARGIEKAYGSGSIQTPVLRGVDLQVRRGECAFLAGPSGSGKSTLLSILGCILSADEGVIRVLGENVSRFSPKEQAQFRRQRLGFVFQRFHLFHGLRAWENVRVAFDLLGYPAAAAKNESFRLLNSVGLAEKAHNNVDELSMGERQRVALARALAGDPELILADEPTASLDAISGMNAMQMLRDLTVENEKTVIVVTHDPRIFPLADRILYLEDGRIAAGTPSPEAAQPHIGQGRA